MKGRPFREKNGWRPIFIARPAFRPKKKTGLIRYWRGFTPFRERSCRRKLSPLEKLQIRASHAGKIRFSLKNTEEELLLLRLALKEEGTEEILAENEYLFTTGRDLGAVFRMEAPELTAEGQEDGFVLKNSGRSAALFVFLTKEKGTPVYWKDNYFTLLPGEEKKLTGEGDWKASFVQALNMEYQKLEVTQCR